MKHLYCLFAFAILMEGCGSDATDNSDTDSTPGQSFGWQTADPASMGMDKERLLEAEDYIRTTGLDITSMVVVKGDRIVLEYYNDENDQETLHSIESSTKSIVSILLGIAIDEGVIDSIDAKVLDFFEDRTFENPSDEKSNLTLRDLLTMQSCLDYDNSNEPFQDEPDVVSFILDHPTKCTPGTEWSYSSADTQLIGAVIAQESGMSLEAYAKARLFDRLDITPGSWMQVKEGQFIAGYGLHLTARDMARFGLFMLKKGVWNGERIVSEKWIDDALTVRAETPWPRGDFGYSWWIKRFEGYCAAGRYGQQINVFPERDLVVVYTAALPMEGADNTLDMITKAFVLKTIDAPDPGDTDGGPKDPCGTTEFEWIETNELVPFGKGVYSFGDNVSTRCLHSVEGNTACLRGLAANAGTGYENWGAGFAIGLAETDQEGNTVSPFDATKEGIHGVRFTLSGSETLINGLRLGMTMVNKDDLEFETNAFVPEGGYSGDITAEGEAVLKFEDLALPSWATGIPKDTPFDAAQIHSLRFQAVTQPGTSYVYDFCISDIDWLDEQGNSIGE